jgi:copper(I)-binding protein
MPKPRGDITHEAGSGGPWGATSMTMRVMAMVGLLFAGLTVAAAKQPGGVTVANAWARATPGGAKNGAVYMSITAEPGAGDRLVAAKSEAARSVELHLSEDEGGVTKMRRLDALEVPAGQTVVLRPGGHHLMLLDLKRPLKATDQLKLTLVFEKAGEVTVEASVMAISSSRPPSSDPHAGPGSDH